MASFDHHAHASLLLDELGAMIGDVGLELNNDGQCQLGTGDETEINLLFAEADGIANLTLVSTVGELLEGDRSAFLAETLRANLYWRGAQGATVSLSPADEIVLHREVPVEAGLEPSALGGAIDELVQMTRAWRLYLDANQPKIDDIVVD